MSSVLSISRSSYYEWRKGRLSNRKRANAKLTQEIRSIYQESKGSCGSPRIKEELSNRGYVVSRVRVARLMRKAGIRAKRRRKYIPTTDSNHGFRISPNLLDRQFEVGKIANAWVSDITYIPCEKGWIYLTIILDLGDRKVLGWSMSKSLKTKDTILPAWEMALSRRKPSEGMIFHSDRGVQYASDVFRKELKKCKTIKQSMSRKANCWDNAVAESFFKSLKNEAQLDRFYMRPNKLKAELFYFIEIWYNRKRLHSALGYKSPLEFERNLFQSNFISNPKYCPAF